MVSSGRNRPEARPANRVPIDALQGDIKMQHSPTAAALLLNGWAGYGSVGAEHAAIACLRLEQRFAMGALIEILACVRRHDLLPCMAAARAGQHGPQDNGAHGLAMSVEGKPA